MNGLDIDAVRAAAERLRGRAIRTPVLHDTPLDALSGARVLLKAECLQRTGSFKFRGAYNALSLLDAQQRRAGVVACSSGNHAQGVALAAALLDTPATIIMPSDAPRAKIENTRAYGAHVIPYDREREDREALTAEFAARTGAAVVLPYDNFDVMAGQGTCGLEIVEQWQARPIDVLLVPASGGGLTAGIVTAFAHASPATEIITVEPEGFDDHARSFAAGIRARNDRMSGSICDALLAATPGNLTFDINCRAIRRGLTASDDATLRAVALALRHLKLVLEPAGAIGIAALLDTPWLRGLTVGVVLSGGNVDSSVLARALALDA